MFKIIIPILVIALAAFVGMNAKSGLIRGVADGMLVSPARPAVAVKPAADFASVDARRVDLSPSVQNSMLQATSVQAVYALYNHEGPQAAPAHLAALLAVSQNDETWPVEPELGFPAIRHKKQDIDGFPDLRTPMFWTRRMTRGLPTSRHSGRTAALSAALPLYSGSTRPSSSSSTASPSPCPPICRLRTISPC